MATAHRFLASIASALVCALGALAAPATHAATFRTFLNDPAGMAAAMGPRSQQAHETFASVVDQQLIGTTPDAWNTFTVEVIGSGTMPGQPQLGATRYCANLSAPSCIYWNGNATAVPGVYAIFNGPTTGVSFKLTTPTIAGFSFSFTDWNDPSDGTGAVMEERSYFQVVASDGSTVDVHGDPQPVNAPPQTFGVALSAADIAAGVYLTEIRWVGLPAGVPEVVGLYHFATFTNPLLAPAPIASIPTLSVPGLALLSASMAGIFLFLRRRRR